MIEQIIVPDIGEGVESGKVVAVYLKTGDAVSLDDTVVELETDKAVVEIPSTLSGTVVEVLAKEGEDLKIGAVIAKVEAAAADTDPSKQPTEDKLQASSAEKVLLEESDRQKATVDTEAPEASPREDTQSTEVKPVAIPSTEKAAPVQPIPASPSIRRLARELGINIYDVEGKGPGGRISEEDIKAHVKARVRALSPIPDAPPMAAGIEPALPDFSRWGDVEVLALEAVRRITAESTTTSWHTVPHVTQFDKADITILDDFIRKNADKVARGGGKLTVTALLTKVCARALKKFPRFNASIDLKNQQLIFKKYIHIGIAVDTPRGLLMPVIQNADRQSITELAAGISDLAKRCRNKKIKPFELEGGTFSISNQGGIGGEAFTPIVLWPQAAILGISRASMAPIYVDGQFQPRKMLPLSLSYDHRIIDGANAARFLRWVCESLENAFTIWLE